MREEEIIDLDDNPLETIKDLSESDTIEDTDTDEEELNDIELDTAVYSRIPKELDTEISTRLEQLISHEYINSEDAKIIKEREDIILLLRAIQLKKLAEDNYSFE